MASATDLEQPIDGAGNAELVALVAAGGGPARDAEAALCRRYARRIRLYGMRHLRDPDATHDLIQIVLMGVLEAVRAGRVREPEHLERFILGTCRNTSIRLRQKENRDRPTESEELEAMLVTLPEVDKVDGRALAGCMEQLEVRARKVVTLAFREDRSAEEIAGQMATTTGNVRVIRHRALAALRVCLEGKGEAS